MKWTVGLEIIQYKGCEKIITFLKLFESREYQTSHNVKIISNVMHPDLSIYT